MLHADTMGGAGISVVSNTDTVPALRDWAGVFTMGVHGRGLEQQGPQDHTQVGRAVGGLEVSLPLK